MTIMGPRTFAAVVILGMVASAGFGAACFVASIVEDALKPKFPDPVVLVIFLAIAGPPNVVAFLLFRKVWRSSETWVFLGHRRRLWQILLLVAYGLGLAGIIGMLTT